MDPQATWNEMLDAITGSDYEEAEACAVALLHWLDRHGFPPNTATRTLPDQWNAMLCRSVCQAVILIKRSIWEAS